MALEFEGSRFPASIKIFLLVMNSLPVFLYDSLPNALRTIAIANGRGEHEESDIRAAGGVAACVNLMFEFLTYEHLVVTSVRLIGHA